MTTLHNHVIRFNESTHGAQDGRCLTWIANKGYTLIRLKRGWLIRKGAG